MSLLVADIGGTNVRFGVAADATAPLAHVRIMTCASYPTFADAIAAFLGPLDITISYLSVAVAGPVNDDLVDVTNNHWAFDKGALMQALGVDGILVINDFTAQALAQSDPTANGNVQICAGASDHKAPLLVIGPGTGLGVSALIPADGDFVPIEGEGGHVSFAPRTADEIALLAFLNQTMPHVSAERVVSGSGLENVYAFMAARAQDSDMPVRLGAPEIGAAALADKGIARDAVNLMLGCLATVIANAVLTMGTWRGVVIAGGIVPHVQSLLADSPFTARFRHQGRMGVLLETVPVWLSVDPLAGIKGAQAAMANRYTTARMRRK
ncbi:glucokinase [Candidatus Puniceispirillum marinum]|uniref:Glucokinase n=1 Tax=Puniceispirillum marinum (strain IMCC1322) TaxID=488538 RepID=D5BN35_PUNMI|nr:glucokinase [Candidatus Puniceispirillum marinum]ADE40228.1 glucokinase [Candidatus Puniceispirillum marinum IMCC1322]